MMNPEHIDSFGNASQDITDAYLIWVLTQENRFGKEDLQNEFDNLDKIAQTSEDPYFLSLYSGALYNVDEVEKAKLISQKVTFKQNKETGGVEGAESSITNSRGQGLILETTSLAIVNWLNQDVSGFSKNIDLGVNFLLNSIKKGGRFGSTQSTVLSLKALVRYTQVYSGLKGSGNFVMYINNKRVKTIHFDENSVTQMSKLDFSQDVATQFKKLHSNDCAPGQDFKLKIGIENYKANAHGDGFALSYLLSLDFKNSALQSTANAPISFAIT